MVRYEDIKRMFRRDGDVFYWLERPRSDFKSVYSHKAWNKLRTGTPFQDGSFIRIKGKGEKFSCHELSLIFDTPTPHHTAPGRQRKASDRERAQENGLAHYYGLSCMKCGNKKRYTDTSKCVRCVDPDSAPFILNRVEASKRFKVINGLLYWTDRPESDFGSYQAYKTWKALFMGKQAGGNSETVSFNIKGVRHRKTVKNIIKVLEAS